MSKSLSEINSSVTTSKKNNFFSKLLSFIGPAYLISIGYMDPGNWATDIAAGSGFGYKLLWVLLLSNVIALLMQSLSVRLGVVRGLDLAQATRETYSRKINFILYLFAEIAIAACDLAEVLGMAIGLNLLFGINILFGIIITLFDTFILLFLINKGIRKTEAFIIGLISTVGVAFVIQLFMVKPNMAEVLNGFIPELSGNDYLYIAIGIIGATIMPHNLYLHSSLVQSRKFNRDQKGIKEAIRFNFIDSFIALNVAFLINAAILVVAGTTFHENGFHEIDSINQAHNLLGTLLGNKIAPFLFALSLIFAGQSSTISGTLAGQIVMEGHINLRLQPWARRIITRSIAIVPAIIVIAFLGQKYANKLLIFSQVILSFQLGFAIIPLIHNVANKEKMNGFAINNFLKITSWFFAVIIISLNFTMVFSELKELLSTSNFILWLVIFIITISVICLLLYITIFPMIRKILRKVVHVPHVKFEKLEIVPNSAFKKIAIAIDFSKVDKEILNNAITIGSKSSEFLLIHIIESATALAIGSESYDKESMEDKKTLEFYSNILNQNGYKTDYAIGFGNPKKQIPKIVNEFNADVLIMGSHGHKFFKDLIYGTTISSVRHNISIPLLVVKNRAL